MYFGFYTNNRNSLFVRFTNMKNYSIYPRDHLFSTCTKFSEKLTFLTQWYTDVWLWGGKKLLVFRKNLGTYKMDVSLISTDSVHGITLIKLCVSSMAPLLRHVFLCQVFYVGNINLFLPKCSLLIPLKTSENRTFSVFRGDQKGTLRKRRIKLDNCHFDRNLIRKSFSFSGPFLSNPFCNNR